MRTFFRPQWATHFLGPGKRGWPPTASVTCRFGTQLRWLVRQNSRACSSSRIWRTTGYRCGTGPFPQNPAQVSASGVGLPFGAPFRCKHRIKHRKRAPGQRGLRVGANLLSRNLDGNQIAWKYRRCAGHANLLFRDGVKRQVGKCDCLLEFTTRPELSQSRARIWPQQHGPKRLKNSATRNSTARSQNRRLAICMA